MSFRQIFSFVALILASLNSLAKPPEDLTTDSQIQITIADRAPLAVAQVGVRPPGSADAGKALLRRISLAVLAPRLTGSDATDAKTCISQAFRGNGDKSVATLLNEELDRLKIPVGHFEPTDAKEYDRNALYAEVQLKNFVDQHQLQLAKMAQGTMYALKTAVYTYEKRLVQTTKCAVFAKITTLILIQRVCGTGSNCGIEGKPIIAVPGNPYTERFDLLALWGFANRPQDAATKFERAGLLAPDIPVGLYIDPVEKNKVLLVEKFGKSEARYIDEESSEKEEPIDDRQKAIEEWVQTLRKKNKAPPKAPQIAFSALSVTDMPLEISTRITDPGVFASVDLALPFLRSDPTAKLSHIKTDLLAVTRIRDCVGLQAISLANAKEVSDCSGYTLTTPADVFLCIQGKECVPPFSGQSLAPIDKNGRVVAGIPASAAQFRKAGMNVAELARANVLPRIRQGTIDELLQKSLGDCATFMTNDGKVSDNLSSCLLKKKIESEAGTSAPAAQCVLEGAKMGANAAAFVADCVKKLPGGDKKVIASLSCISNSGDELGACLLKSQLGDKELAEIACLRKPANSQIQKLTCIAEGRGVAAAAMKQCLDKQDSKCLLELLPGRAKEAAVAIQECTTVSNTKSAISCALALGVKLPPEMSVAASCIAETWQAMAGCMVTHRVGVGGDLLVLADCYAQGGGTPQGAAACVVSRQLNFNKDLQIALQCAASTGGFGPAAGICTFGQLTLREMTFCSGKHVGEGECFGENNTIIKTFGIGKNSAFAELINKHLDVMTDTMAFVQNPGATVAKIGGNFDRELSIARNNIKRELGGGFVANAIANVIVPPSGGVYVKADSTSITVGGTSIRWNPF